MDSSASQAELHYYPSFVRQIVVLLGCAAFTAVGIVILLAGGLLSVEAVLIGWTSIHFFGPGGAFLLVRFLAGLIAHRPVLVVNGFGFTFPSPLVRASPIPWEDVTQIA